MNKIHRSTLVKLYFLIGSLIIVMFFIFYNNSLLVKAREEAQIVPRFFAKFAAISTYEDIEGKLLQLILNEIVKKIDYPIIVTDKNNIPQHWKNLSIQGKKFEELSEEEKSLLMKKIKIMKKKESSINLTLPNSDEVISYIYYGESKAMKRLKFLPYFEFLVMLIFIAVGVFGVIYVHQGEKRSLWMALAKETAHQFGTPLSSLMGWMDILKIKTKEYPNSQSIREIIDSATIDINQLKKVAFRFGKVGSSIKLKESSLEQVIQETIEYFNLRLPQVGNRISLNHINRLERDDYFFDDDLMKWVLENLIKNSIDAMQNTSGNISIITFDDVPDKYVHIQVRDEGKGIPSNLHKKIFNTGITTKSRGWGLGLSLAKRIVEEFHKGKIYVLESVKNQGTTIEILLPKEMK